MDEHEEPFLTKTDFYDQTPQYCQLFSALPMILLEDILIVYTLINQIYLNLSI